MSRAGKSGREHRLLAIAAVLSYALVPRIAGPLLGIQLVFLLLVLQFVIQPVSTLIHELGHAAVARWVTKGRVSVVVGRSPYLKFAVAGVQVHFSFLPNRGVCLRGICRSDNTGVSWRNRARRALAGPAATFLELCVVAALGASLWAHAGVFERSLIGYTVLALVISLVVNLVPRNVGTIPNDGAQILAALRHDRAQLPLPTPKPASPSTRPRLRPKVPMSAEVNAYATRAPSAAAAPIIDRELDAKRARKSIPPPGTD
jgi:hypothetical protein